MTEWSRINQLLFENEHAGQCPIMLIDLLAFCLQLARAKEICLVGTKKRSCLDQTKEWEGY